MLLRTSKEKPTPCLCPRSSTPPATLAIRRRHHTRHIQRSAAGPPPSRLPIALASTPLTRSISLLSLHAHFLNTSLRVSAPQRGQLPKLPATPATAPASSDSDWSEDEVDLTSGARSRSSTVHVDIRNSSNLSLLFPEILNSSYIGRLV